MKLNRRTLLLFIVVTVALVATTKGENSSPPPLDEIKAANLVKAISEPDFYLGEFERADGWKMIQDFSEYEAGYGEMKKFFDRSHLLNKQLGWHMFRRVRAFKGDFDQLIFFREESGPGGRRPSFPLGSPGSRWILILQPGFDATNQLISFSGTGPTTIFTDEYDENKQFVRTTSRLFEKGRPLYNDKFYNEKLEDTTEIILSFMNRRRLFRLYGSGDGGFCLAWPEKVELTGTNPLRIWDWPKSDRLQIYSQEFADGLRMLVDAWADEKQREAKLAVIEASTQEPTLRAVAGKLLEKSREKTPEKPATNAPPLTVPTPAP